MKTDSEYLDELLLLIDEEQCYIHYTPLLTRVKEIRAERSQLRNCATCKYAKIDVKDCDNCDRPIHQYRHWQPKETSL
jgi:hypothetical protein